MSRPATRELPCDRLRAHQRVLALGVLEAGCTALRHREAITAYVGTTRARRDRLPAAVLRHDDRARAVTDLGRPTSPAGTDVLRVSSVVSAVAHTIGCAVSVVVVAVVLVLADPVRRRPDSAQGSTSPVHRSAWGNRPGAWPRCRPDADRGTCPRPSRIADRAGRWCAFDTTSSLGCRPAGERGHVRTRRHHPRGGASDS